MKGNARFLIGGPLNGGILTAVIWWVVNRVWNAGGIGVLQQQPWPLSSIYACAAIGAMLGMALGMTLVLLRTGHANRIAALCQRLNFQYMADVAREQLPTYHSLRLFEPRRWHEARNLMRGRFDGGTVELLDYEFVERGDESTTHYRQTVALFPDCGGKLPPFELAPRGLIIKLLYRVAGLEGITFEPAKSTSGWDRDAIDRFGELYFVSPRLNESLRAAELRRVQSELGGDAADEAPPVPSEQAIRRLFNVELLRTFVDRPGWSVESDGVNLAVWRSRRIVPAADREEFLREAGALRFAIVKATNAKATAPPLPGTSKMLDPRSLIAGTGAWMLGSFFGFIVGGAIGFGAMGLLVWRMNDPSPALVFPIFFGFPISGFILGGVICSRWQRDRRAASRDHAESHFQIDASRLHEHDRQTAAKVETGDLDEAMMTLHVNSRTIEVDCRPLADTESANFRAKRLVRYPSRLVIEPSHGTKLFAVFLLAIGIGFVAMGIAMPTFWRDWPAELGGVLAKAVMFVLYPVVWLAALLFSGCGLLFLFGVGGTVLDRGSGRLQYVPKRKWRSVSRPLSDIVALQLIRGALHSVVADNEPPYQSYQLNLVLDDSAEPRINLCDDTAVAWQFETGQDLAQFLGRPFIDRVSDSGGSIPACVGEVGR